MDGGYSLFLSGSNGIDTVQISIQTSPAMGFVSVPSAFFLAGGTVPQGHAIIDGIGSGNFAFFEGFVEIYDQTTGTPLATATMFDGGIVVTSFTATNVGSDSESSSGTFLVLPPNPTPEPASVWFGAIGAMGLTLFRKRLRG
jgi:hypothetical protein